MSARVEAILFPAEERLITRCRLGETAAFEELYVLYEGLVFRHAYHLTGDCEDAQDIRQETFVRAYRTIRSFRGECEVRTWLLKICSNLCRNRWRSKQRRREVSLDEMDLDPRCQALDAKLPGAGQESELAATMLDALGGLPPSHREIIILRDIEGLSARETAEIVGCSPASVGVKLLRARRLLKSRVEILFRAED